MMDGLIAVADALDRIAQERYGKLGPEDRVEIEDVLEAAWEWDHTQLPIQEFAKVGTLLSPGSGKPSSGYTRYVATLATPVTDKRRGPLLRAIDALLRFQGIVITTKGIFEPAEIVDIPIHGAPDPWHVQARRKDAA